MQEIKKIGLHDLDHVASVGRWNVGSPMLRQAGALLVFEKATDVRAAANANNLAQALDGLVRHLNIPKGLKSFEAFFLAMFAVRHSGDVSADTVPEWISELGRLPNPKFGSDWTFSHCVRITHSHAMLNAFDTYCVAAKQYYIAMPDKTKAIRSLVTAQRWRSEDVVRMLTERRMYLTTWHELADFGDAWESAHAGTPLARYPGRRLWPDGRLSSGSTGEAKRCSIGDACTTMRAAFDEAKYKRATKAKKQEMLASLPQIGELNQSHLSRVLGFAAECGYANIAAAGSNAQYVLRVMGGTTLDAVAKRVAPFLKSMRALPKGHAISAEEVQMDLCIVLETLQTFLVGTNAHHPRLSLGEAVSAPSLLARDQHGCKRRKIGEPPGATKKKTQHRARSPGPRGPGTRGQGPGGREPGSPGTGGPGAGGPGAGNPGTVDSTKLMNFLMRGHEKWCWRTSSGPPERRSA